MSGRGVGERADARGHAVPDPPAVTAVVAAGVAVAVAAVLLAHVLGAGSLDPVALTVSDYVAVPGGGVLLGLAAAGLATAGAALVRAVPGRGWPRAVAVLLSAWCVALVLVAVFPTNAPGSAPDLAAAVHRWAGAGVFALPPVAGLLVLRRTGAPVTAWAPTVAAGAGALVFLLCHAPAVLSGAPPFPLLGVVERVAHLLLCGQVLALGRRAGSPATPRVAAVSR